MASRAVRRIAHNWSTLPQLRFEKLLILDFEATCSDRNEFPRNQMEIVELPTLVYDIETRTVQNVFHEYIKPVLHPTLTQFCHELTGITQSQVDSSLPFPEVWSKYISFLTAQGVFESPQKFCFVTCGDWDFKTMLPLELARYPQDTRPVHKIFDRWINVKNVYTRAPGQGKGMAAMLQGLGLTLEGRHHSGIDDCKNIASIVKKLQENGWDAQSSKFTTKENK